MCYSCCDALVPTELNMSLFILKGKAFITKLLLGILFLKNASSIYFFSITFKDMLEFNAMVKGKLPQVKVLFVFPLTYRAFLLNKTEELKDPRIIQLP